MFAVWGAAAVGIIFGYRPPKRHTRLDHLSFWQKLGHLDLPGFALLTSGLTLFSVGLSLGGGLYPWTDAHTLATLIVGFVVLVAFGVYEWKGTTSGILNHELFRGGKNKGRVFAICNGLMVVESILGFPFIVFYSVVYVQFISFPLCLLLLAEVFTLGQPLCSLQTLSCRPFVFYLSGGSS